MSDKNYRDLNTPQLFELVLAIKQFSKIVSEYESPNVEMSNIDKGTSVIVQEFDKTGTKDVASMNHLRVHIIPRW